MKLVECLLKACAAVAGALWPENNISATSSTKVPRLKSETKPELCFRACLLNFLVRVKLLILQKSNLEAS